MDGTSVTLYFKDGLTGWCLRNWQIEPDSEGTSTYAKVGLEFIELLQELARNLALQGEIIGDGIQKNRYNVEGPTFNLFDIMILMQNST